MKMPDTEKKKKLISFSETPANLQLSNEAEYRMKNYGDRGG